MAELAPKKAEAPKLAVGDKVIVNNKAVGEIAFLGPVDFAVGEWIGVVLNRPTGLIDGTVLSKKTGVKRSYFTCKPNHGLFVRPRSVQPFDPKILAALQIQAATRGHATRVRLEEELAFKAFTELDEDLERLGMERAMKLVKEGRLDERQEAVMVDSKEIDDIEVDEKSAERCTLHFADDGSLPREDVLNLLQLFKDTGKLHEKFALGILYHFYKREATMSSTINDTVIESGSTLTVVGDLHGQWEDFMTIFTMNGLPSAKNRYLFNGDFVDRGPSGTEIALLLFAFRLSDPTAVMINRGNHECFPQNFQYGFADEVLTKFNCQWREKIFWSIQRCFKTLPLATVLNKRVFVVHGGLFRCKGVKLDHLRAVERQRDIPPVAHSANRFHDNLFEDLMWSDPGTAPGAVKNTRGAGVVWGPDLTRDFLKNNHLGLVVRSHEPPIRGHEFQHDRRVVTIFSASMYCGQANRGAYMIFESNLHYAIHSFVASQAQGPQINAAMQREMARSVTTKMIIENVCAHKAELYSAFEGLDTANSGMVSKDAWAFAMAQVTQLDLPWLWVCNNVCDFVDKPKTLIDYLAFLDRYSIAMKDGWQDALLNRICRALYTQCSDVKDAYRYFDIDSNGKVAYQEFIEGVRKLKAGLTDGQIFDLLRDVDTDKNGYIDVKEFQQHFGIRTSFFVKDNDAVNAGILEVGKWFFTSGKTSEEVFAALDANTDATISQAEFVEGVKSLGVKLDDDVLGQIFKAVDVDASGRIDPVEFMDAFFITYQSAKKAGSANGAGAGAGAGSARPSSADSKKSGTGWNDNIVNKVIARLFECRSSVQALCRLMDADGDGYITRDEFKTGLTTLGLMGERGDEVSDMEVDMVLSALDANNDGKVSFEEFHDAFKLVDNDSGKTMTPTPMAAPSPRTAKVHKVKVEATGAPAAAPVKG